MSHVPETIPLPTTIAWMSTNFKAKRRLTPVGPLGTNSFRKERRTRSVSCRWNNCRDWKKKATLFYASLILETRLRTLMHPQFLSLSPRTFRCNRHLRRSFWTNPRLTRFKFALPDLPALLQPYLRWRLSTRNGPTCLSLIRRPPRPRAKLTFSRVKFGVPRDQRGRAGGWVQPGNSLDSRVIRFESHRAGQKSKTQEGSDLREARARDESSKTGQVLHFLKYLSTF